MRCNDEIQLFEGPALLLCPWPGFAASVGKTGFGAFLFEAPASENEVEGICPSVSICKIKIFRSLVFHGFEESEIWCYQTGNMTLSISRLQKLSIKKKILLEKSSSIGNLFINKGEVLVTINHFMFLFDWNTARLTFL